MKPQLTPLKKPLTTISGTVGQGHDERRPSREPGPAARHAHTCEPLQLTVESSIHSVPWEEDATKEAQACAQTHGPQHARVHVGKEESMSYQELVHGLQDPGLREAECGLVRSVITAVDASRRDGH